MCSNNTLLIYMDFFVLFFDLKPSECFVIDV